MKRVLMVVLVLAVLPWLNGCGKTAKVETRELNLSGLLQGWTYHAADGAHRSIFDLAGATFTSYEVANIQVGEAELVNGEKGTWIRCGGEQFFFLDDQDTVAKSDKLVLRLARIRLNDLEVEADFRYTTFSADGKTHRVDLLEDVDPPAPFKEPLPEMWWESERCTIDGVARDALKGLTFEYRCSAGDDWRIDGNLLAHGAHELTCWDLHEGMKPDIVVTWVDVTKDDHVIRVAYKGIVRDLVRVGSTAADFDREVAVAFNTIANARAGKKVVAYAKLDGGDIRYIEALKRSIKLMDDIKTGAKK